MRSEHLFYFTRVVELSSLTLASENLYVSQQALSAAIKNLEKIFGVKLFNRTHSGLSVTTEGMYIYNKAKIVLSTLNEMESHFANSNLFDMDGSLTIALVPEVKNTYLSKVITHFYKYYPNVKLTFTYESKLEILNLLANKEADVGFFNSTSIGQNHLHNLPTCLSFTPFAKHSCDLITSADSHLAGYASISMKTIAKYPLVFASDYADENSCYQSLIKYYGLEHNATFIDVPSLLQEMVADNLANSIMPSKAFLSKDKIIHIPISDNIKIVSGYLLNAEIPPKESLRLFIETFLQLLPRNMIY